MVRKAFASSCSPKCLEDKAQTTADIEEGGVYSHACLGLHTVLRIGSMKHTDHGHEPDKKSLNLQEMLCPLVDQNV